MFQRWILPGLLFQSVLIGGGYATGRELVEFFLSLGAMAGLFGLLLSTCLFSLIAIVFFEFARVTRSANYKDLFRHLIGRGWVLYEIGYVLLGILILSVVGAAAGEIANTMLGVSPAAGALLLCLLIVYLVFRGTGFIERVLAGWSFLLYAVYLLFIGLFLSKEGDQLATNLSQLPQDFSWVRGGIEYVGYNMVVLPVILFVVQHFENRRDSIIAGAMAGPLAMLPAILFYLAMCADKGSIAAEPVPSDYIIRMLDLTWLSILFYITIFGTFVETGSAFIHAFNQRLAESWTQRGWLFRDRHRALVAITSLLVSIFLADTFGLVGLIAQGYGTLTWYFIVIFMLPLFFNGIPVLLRGAKS